MHTEMHRVMGALADPTRLAMVERLLEEGKLSAGDLAQPFAVSKPAISRHLKVLEESGIIERKIEAQYRYFCVRRAAFREIEDWVQRYRRCWESAFDRLDRFASIK